MLAAVKQAVGNDLAVLAKINVADGVRRGATAEDGMVTAVALERAGADMLVLSGGRNVESTWFMFGSNMHREEIAVLIRPLLGNEDVPLPQYQSAEAVAMDIHAAMRKPVRLAPRS